MPPFHFSLTFTFKRSKDYSQYNGCIPLCQLRQKAHYLRIKCILEADITWMGYFVLSGMDGWKVKNYEAFLFTAVVRRVYIHIHTPLNYNHFLYTTGLQLLEKLPQKHFIFFSPLSSFHLYVTSYPYGNLSLFEFYQKIPNTSLFKI